MSARALRGRRGRAARAGHPSPRLSSDVLHPIMTIYDFDFYFDAEILLVQDLQNRKMHLIPELLVRKESKI
ncbi:hypothetical protein EVAR_45251_1 [Eumeta japonica]|uniref:Uncharacterized protein n=1 Tax=Eumeta variegata TaxID=151549 RepID=A0A4C1XE29_EUMVA|nr:hypothetical protein EVAR_45251_1 [Eumeta japonica]